MKRQQRLEEIYARLEAERKKDNNIIAITTAIFIIIFVFLSFVMCVSSAGAFLIFMSV